MSSHHGTGSCHQDVPATKVASLDLGSADGLIVLARIEIVAILVQYQPSNQLPTAACRCHYALWDVSCRQSWHLLTPSHPRVPREWPYCLCTVRMLDHCLAKHCRPPDLKPSSKVRLPFAWITVPATDPNLSTCQHSLRTTPSFFFSPTLFLSRCMY